MTCVNPITVWKKRWASLTDSPQKYYEDKKVKFKKPRDYQNYEEIKIACGRCIGCRLDHANMWATRVLLESQEHKENCFITITYNNENLPLTKTNHMTLRKKEFQDFLKRLREQLRQKNIKISYFGAGEYGETTFRPHGHFAIMGWQPKDLERIMNSKTDNPMFTSKKLCDIWGKGYVVIQELNFNTACYIARYVQKKAGIKGNKRIISKEPPEPELKIDERNGKPFIRLKTKYVSEKTDKYGREKEFLLMSKKPAIGLRYWTQHFRDIILNEGILIKHDGHVKKKPIPRYFKKIWEKSNMEQLDWYQYKSKEKAKINHENDLKNIDADDKEKRLLETVKKNLTDRSKFLKREQN